MDSSICSVFVLWRYARQRNVIPHLSSATEHHFGISTWRV